MYLRKSNSYELLLEGVEKFAWLPVELDNGAIIWWDSYYKTIKRFNKRMGSKFLEPGRPFTTDFGLIIVKVKHIENYKKTGNDE
jgi:diaminopimelate decarboxylase